MSVADVRPYISKQYTFLQCPSDDTGGPSTDLWYWDGVSIGTTNYKGCIGDHAMTDSIN